MSMPKSVTTIAKLIGATFAVAALLATGLVTAPSPVNAAETFRHDPQADLQGYYVPEWNVQTGVTTSYRAGNFVLAHIAIGSLNELKKYETSGPDADMPNYAPVMLQFDDTTSKTGENELGQTYYEITERILPDTYSLSADSVTVSGTGGTLGPVTFTAKPDLKKIEAARNNPAHISDGPALIGTLTVGDTVIEDVKLMWYGGE
tara:strand:+ start:2486 stop:3097 length:612 start_codon:yes stop_codon:yes gene_type:complete